MKIITYILVLVAIIAAVCAALPLYGQERQPAPSVTPASQAAPAEAAPAASASVMVMGKQVSLQLVYDQVSAFFDTLRQGEVDRAYDVLTKNSKIGDNVSDVTTLKDKTRQAIKLYGAIRGYENTQVKPVGTHLVRITCLSLGSELPLRWRFYFYESAAGWKLIDLRVDDRLVDLFGESAEAEATPAL